MPFVPDPDFLTGCIHRVAVFTDANKSGAVTTDRGGVHRGPRPVAGQESVACRVVPDLDAQVDVDHKPGAQVRHKVLLPRPLGWDQNTVVDYTDSQGVVHRLFVQGQPRNAHEMDTFWVARAIEFVA